MRGSQRTFIALSLILGTAHFLSLNGHSLWGKDTCQEYTRIYYWIDLKTKNLTKVASKPISDSFCEKLPEFQHPNVILEIREPKRNSILFSKKLFLPLTDYADFYKSGKITGGSFKAKKTLLNTLIPRNLQSAEKMELIISHLKTKKLLGRGFL